MSNTVLLILVVAFLVVAVAAMYFVDVHDR